MTGRSVRRSALGCSVTTASGTPSASDRMPMRSSRRGPSGRCTTTMSAVSRLAALLPKPAAHLVHEGGQTLACRLDGLGHALKRVLQSFLIRLGRLRVELLPVGLPRGLLLLPVEILDGLQGEVPDELGQ